LREVDGHDAVIRLELDNHGPIHNQIEAMFADDSSSVPDLNLAFPPPPKFLAPEF